jgi:GR25 family glycosyltransferase involved in LPS biosynthesis
VQKFIESNKDVVVFIAKPTAKVIWALEDLIQFRKRFIRIKPPLSKGASGYILNYDLARKLSDYIKVTNINLPIDLLLTYWAHEMGIKIYWVRRPFISEGSGKTYKSSLR